MIGQDCHDCFPNHTHDSHCHTIFSSVGSGLCRSGTPLPPNGRQHFLRLFACSGIKKGNIDQFQRGIDWVTTGLQRFAFFLDNCRGGAATEHRHRNASQGWGKRKSLPNVWEEAHFGFYFDFQRHPLLWQNLNLIFCDNLESQSNNELWYRRADNLRWFSNSRASRWTYLMIARQWSSHLMVIPIPAQCWFVDKWICRRSLLVDTR